MIELTDEQRRDLDNSGPVRVRDPKTNETYVLVPTHLYEQVKSLFESDGLSDAERRAIVRGVWERTGWDDPAMDDYAALDPRKST
jgi:hypothetical protein